MRSFFLLMTVILLAGCGIPPSGLHPAQPDLEQLVAERQALSSARLALVSDKDEYRSGETFEVAIRLANPEEKSIASVRSWVAFDPSKLKVVELRDTASDFDLTLSQENSFDNAAGLIRIGRSSQKPLALEEARVHVLVFQVLPTDIEKNTSLDFYDYEESTGGYTGVYELTQGNPRNILQAPQVPGLRLTLLP